MRAPIISLFLFSLLTALPQIATQQSLHSGEDSSLRGLSSSSANDQTILYATGSSGTILRSPNSGKSWSRLHIDAADLADFRGVQSFAANIAYIFSVGNDNKSHIYKTFDAGKSWSTQYSDPRSAFFLDGLVCRTEEDCFAISDPIDNKFPILHTADGEHWTELPKATEPAALPTEGVFAASNSSLILCGQNNSDIFFATGGPAARVYHSADNAKTWTAVNTPILHGTASAGIFSIACSGRIIVAVGGDYKNPSVPQTSILYSTDFGATWHTPKKSTEQFRSAVTAINSTTWIAVGTTGTDISTDNALTWSPLKKQNANAVLALDPHTAITAGPNATITQLNLP